MMGAALASALPAGSTAQALPFDFDSWMRQEQRRVFLLCMRVLHDRDEADMAAQDSFLKAYRHLCQPGDASAPTRVAVEDLTKWITRVAINTCLDRLRSRAWKFWRRRPSPESEERILEVAINNSPSPEDDLRAGEISQRLNAALLRLSPRQRAIFVLKHYEDRKLDEIGEILGLEVGTVKAHMARAVARLRVELADLYGSMGTREAKR